MQLVIRLTRKYESVYDHAARRVGLVLSRFAPRVLSVTVVVAGADGGQASCSVRVRCSPSWDVMENVVDEDPRAAMERAVARAGRTLERGLGSGGTLGGGSTREAVRIRVNSLRGRPMA